MPPKSKGAVPIAPGTSEQTQGRRPTSLFSSGTYRSAELPPRVRTGHACDRCRELRAKCSGGNPCAKCTKDEATCHYSDRKRERTRKNLERNAAEIADLNNDKRRLVEALTSVTHESDFEPAKHTRLLRLLDDMTSSEESPEASSSTQSQPPRSRSTERTKPEESPMDVDDDAAISDDGSHGEMLVRSDVGSPDRLRELTAAVDLDFGNGMPGYVGKMANIAWLQRIKAYLSGSSFRLEFDLPDSELDKSALETVNLSYWAEDENLLAVDEDHVEPHQLPPLGAARVLTEAYFAATQNAFRFVDRDSILRDLETLYARMAPMRRPSWQQWHLLALLNIMWAVAAKWLLVTGLDKHETIDGLSNAFEYHLVYYARARSLGLDHRIQIDHPSLEMLQSMSVLGFYLLVNGSIHRAWGIIAQTIRHSTALGLHLKIAEGALPSAQQAHRARLWWSLYRIEVILSEITGRPKCLRESEMTVPLSNGSPSAVSPASVRAGAAQADTKSSAILNDFMGPAVDVAKSISGGKSSWPDFLPMALSGSDAYFFAALELSKISDKIAGTLYLSPDDLTWADVQSTLRHREKDIASWQEEVAPKLRRAGPDETALIDPRSALDLQLNLCSLQMILYRPFLCDIHISEESPESSALNQRCARACVRAAIDLIEHLPDSPVPQQVTLLVPWWRLLHYIAQVVAVIVLEMCLSLQHMQDNETNEVVFALQKALNYLWAFAPESKSVYRAWCLYRAVVERAAEKAGQNELLNGIPREATQPADWGGEDERWVANAVGAIVRSSGQNPG